MNTELNHSGAKTPRIMALGINTLCIMKISILLLSILTHHRQLILCNTHSITKERIETKRTIIKLSIVTLSITITYGTLSATLLMLSVVTLNVVAPSFLP